MGKARTIKVDFGNVSVGKETCRLSVKMGRNDMDIGVAEAMFCGARLRTSLVVTADDPALLPEVLPNLEAVVDAKKMLVGVEDISVSLTFNKKDTDLKVLSAFASMSGEIIAERIGDAKDAKEPEGD